MKLGVVFIFGFILAGCSMFTEQQLVEERYFVPVIRSDVSASDYTPIVTPTTLQKETRRIYTPVIR